MKINKQEISQTNQTIEIRLSKEDYQPSVDKKLQEYRKTANLPGFRKGQIPISLLRKKHENFLIVDEVKEILNKAIEDYIEKNSLKILGKPLAINEDKINWEEKNFSFEFELGLVPAFNIDLKKIKATYYKILVEEKEIKKHINKIKNSLGEIKEKDKIEIFSKVQGEISFLEENKKASLDSEKSKYTFDIKELSGENQKKFLKAQLNQNLELYTKKLFADKEKTNEFLEGRKDFSFHFKIEKIYEIIPHELNQELFDKVYGKNLVKTKEEFEEKIKEEFQKSYIKQVDYYLLNEVIKELIKNTEFELPEDFLLRFIKKENPKLDLDQIKKEYEESEKSIRYQLIENKLIEEFSIEFSQEELEEEFEKLLDLEYKKAGIKTSKAKLKEVAKNFLRDQKQVDQLSKEILKKKLISIFKEHISLKEEEITWEAFFEKIKEK